MSDLGAYPAPEHPAPPSGDPFADIPSWVLVAAVVLALILGGAVAFVVLVDDKTEAATRSYPKKWDPRVAPYVKIAEKQRGLSFLHPVEVRFLPADEFEKEVTADEKDLDDEARAELEQATGLLRALGLMTGDVDLFAAVNEVSGAGILAYYSFDDESITIRGKKVTPAIRSTLVHELTHVLQDQQFHVGDRSKELDESEDATSSSEGSVLDSIIEGDAKRVEALYRDSLTAKQRKALDAGKQGENDRADKEFKKVPKVLLTMMSSPYVLGEALVQTVAADGGNDAVDDLFRDTPTHESALLEPLKALSGDSDVRALDLPELKDGEVSIDSGELGVLTWYFMLAERLPLRDALTAADGWGGDAYVAFERDGDACVRTTYAGETRRDTREMFSALQQWVRAAPGSPALVKRDRVVVRFESCDPGKAAKVGKDASQDALQFVTTRTYLGLALLRTGVPAETSACLAGRLVQAFPVSQLVDPQFGASDPAVQARVSQLAEGCR